MSLYNHNRDAWDQLVEKNQRHTRPVSEDYLQDPLKRIDPRGWLEGPVREKRVLCLAAGGGYQSALYAAAGAHVTVVDISPAMLQLDREVAEKYGFEMQIVEASMDHMPMLESNSFDIVAQPVSTCYVPDILKVYLEVSRVLVQDGIYISQHKQPTSLQSEPRPEGRYYRVTEPYYRTGSLPPVLGSNHREPGTHEFLHRWEQLIGSMCLAGFVIEDLTEPYLGNKEAKHGSFEYRSQYLPPYVRMKARLVRKIESPDDPNKIWTP